MTGKLHLALLVLLLVGGRVVTFARRVVRPDVADLRTRREEFPDRRKVLQGPKAYLGPRRFKSGLRSLSTVLAKDKLNWQPDSGILGPGPVILVSPSSNECGDISLDDCLKELQTFLRLKSLPFTSQKEELDKLCSTLVAGSKCSTGIWNVPNCLSPSDQRMIRVFVDMGQYTMLMFCPNGDGQEGYLRDDLLQNSECIQKQRKAMDCCAEQTKVPDLPVLRLLEGNARNLYETQIAECCPVSNYVRCVRESVLANCGEVAANLTYEYVRRASGEEFESVCQKMPGYPELDEGTCKTTVPVCAAGTALAPAQVAALLLPCLLLLTNLKLSFLR